jgi:dihydrolipoamide dehydrogenase
LSAVADKPIGAQEIELRAAGNGQPADQWRGVMVMGELTRETDVLVIGGGPGGYAAAFRAADLGLDVTLVDEADRLGGVCLHRGCIPSKTFLYIAELIQDARRARHMGISFGRPRIDLEALRAWKRQVIEKMADGLDHLSKRREIQVIRGRAVFEDSDMARIRNAEISRIKYKHAVLASGSAPIPFPGTRFKRGGRIMSSSGALNLTDIPQRLLVIGGGYVGLEVGSVYAALGSRVCLVELQNQLLPGVDRDLVQPLHRRLSGLFEGIYPATRIVSMKENATEVEVEMEGDVETPQRRFDRVLVAIGRKPNTDDLSLEKTKVELDDQGFVRIDDQQRTSDERIFAVGDVAGGFMLAHKATREGKIAAEVIAGKSAAFDARAIPAVVYTDPQIAWCGVTEEQAQKENIPIAVQRFPWKFSGRAVTMGAPEGVTKIIIDPGSQRIVGVGITGRDTEGLISEGVLAIEMGALVEDMALSIHPHPTLSETEGETAEMFLGSAIHIIAAAAKK